MTNYNERLDEMLAAVYLAGTENGLRRRLTEAKEIMHRKEAFIRGNPASKKSKQAITSLMKELVAEAKPMVASREVIETYLQNGMPQKAAEYHGRNHAINQFEQNLLKELEKL